MRQRGRQRKQGLRDTGTASNKGNTKGNQEEKGDKVPERQRRHPPQGNQKGDKNGDNRLTRPPKVGHSIQHGKTKKGTRKETG